MTAYLTGGYYAVPPTDDGWSAIALIIFLAAMLYGIMWYDKRRGRYPRDWKD